MKHSYFGKFTLILFIKKKKQVSTTHPTRFQISLPYKTSLKTVKHPKGVFNFTQFLPFPHQQKKKKNHHTYYYIIIAIYYEEIEESLSAATTKNTPQPPHLSLVEKHTNIYIKLHNYTHLQ